VIEPEGGSASAQHAVANCRHVQVSGHGLADAGELALAFQAGYKFSQVAIFHDFGYKEVVLYA
jgi:hypothetical protein